MSSLCATYHFLQSAANNLTSLTAPPPGPLQLSFTDAWGAYRATLLPGNVAAGGEDAGRIGSSQECSDEDFNAETFDPRRSMVRERCFFFFRTMLVRLS